MLSRNSGNLFSRPERLFTNEKLNLALAKFSKAVARLEEAVAQPPSPIQPDAVLQRFEFTFELLWKAVRIYLAETEGIQVSSPKATLKAAFRHGLIQDSEEGDFLQMLEDRNTSSHVYDELQANEIFTRVCNMHLLALQNVLSRLVPRPD